MIDNITGIILAGGKSSRMGEDKAFIPFSNRPLIEILIERLFCLFKDVIIVTNKPHLYRGYNVEMKRDVLKDCGPLGGIYTGLIHSKNMYNFIIACDMPFINLELIKYMLRKIDKYDAVIPKYNDRLEPLCAVYSKNCIKSIEKKLSNKNLKVTDFIKHLRVETITEREIDIFNPDRSCFVNINTPQDYQQVKDSLIAQAVI